MILNGVQALMMFMIWFTSLAHVLPILQAIEQSTFIIVTFFWIPIYAKSENPIVFLYKGRRFSAYMRVANSSNIRPDLII